ncbi:hypothetical protein Poli38472_014651 [Pythium oligandrum]|uniref:Uncharacterized protein n=1 Tax=Pythium oligandrum TaxID=41045 RepID=A0A8K1FIL3_PYTOL|nr:hypothetical protein Poli38472_014651 [Pythium oligandrum]|eukprot:TMW63946.1 hypothetical protein Poli38472_014651 [Pythium oligandrum]
MESNKTSGAASGAGSASATASASSTALRRSKRDATTRVVAVKSEENAAPAASQRRSQRSSKSTYATPSVATPATKDKRPSRSQRSSGSTIKEESVKSASVPPPISTSSETSAKHRRPSRRQSRQLDAAPTPTAASGGTRSAAQARRLFLGQYSARCATALCEVILQQMKTQACDPRVLESEVSPAEINWTDVATQMAKLHQVIMKPRECQLLWKFLAYGHEPVEGTDLLDGSDTEDYEITSHVLNERRRHQAIEIKQEETLVVSVEATNECEQTEDATSNSKRTNELETALAIDSQQTTEGENVEQPTPNSTEEVAQKPQLQEEVAPEGTSATQEENHPLVRLHPIYTQPSGVPDGWESLPPQPSLPLVYVAEKFLKRKPAVPVGAPTPVQPGATITASTSAHSTPSQTAPGLNAHQIAAAAGVMLSEEQPKPKAKRKRKSDAGADTSKKQPKPLISSSTPNAMKAPYVTSNTPPPNPTPPRNPVEFFYQIYKENPRVVVFDAQVPPPSSLSIEQLYALFQRAPPVVRSRCEQLALDDQERFNRECVRRRIWEKAMTSATNSPAVTPVPSPAPLSVPTATKPSAQPSATTTTSLGAPSSTQSAVKAPSQPAGSS